MERANAAQATQNARRELAGKPVLVVGMARSGIAACEFLLGCGADIVATDVKRRDELSPDVLRLGERGVRLELGGHRQETFERTALIVVSPGVPWNLAELEAARRAGVAVIGELELASRYASGRIVAVTGTKGKSTATAAIGAMLREAGVDVRVGGNIGHPAIGLVYGATPRTTFVWEVSSFQLEGIRFFRPHVAAFLNLHDDHLDRHGSRESYASAKGRIFMNQAENDWAVVNADDADVQELARTCRARQLPFSGHPLPGEGAFLEGDRARMRLGEYDEVLFHKGDVQLPGQHLLLDLIASAAVARLLGALPDAIARAARSFAGAEHVLERVADIGGVIFYNDSKATNVESARLSLESFNRPIVAIMGGRHKGGDFGALRQAAARTRVVIAIGEARPLLTQSLMGVTEVISCETLPEAVKRAYRAAQPGDVVVLAPACASFDMFVDYAERGRAFKTEVLRLSLKEGAA